MFVPLRLLASLLLFLVTASHAEAAATLFRLFLTDGTSVVSYGEFARLGDRVGFSMPIGGQTEQPRLFPVTLAGHHIDWAKTDRYASSARYAWYAAERGEEDFARMSRDVALVLNEVATAADRTRALEIAEGARRTLAGWPGSHYGFRQGDVREIVAILDEAISSLRIAVGVAEFDVALVAEAERVPLEPLLGMPTAREQLDQVFHVARLTEASTDRIALYQAALALIAEAGRAISAADARAFRRSAEAQIRDEIKTDAKYAVLTRRLMASAARATSRARIDDVEKALNQVAGEDARLGARRPDAIQALRASLQAQLDDARRLRLLRDQWTIRRGLYRDYQGAAGVQLLQLAKLQPELEAIRTLNGPSPEVLRSLRGRLDGGSARLERIGASVPPDLRATNDLLVGAWRFAESAVNARYSAVTTGNVATAWEASSAAAAALLLLGRSQQEFRALLDPPRASAEPEKPKPVTREKKEKRTPRPSPRTR